MVHQHTAFKGDYSPVKTLISVKAYLLSKGCSPGHRVHIADIDGAKVDKFDVNIDELQYVNVTTPIVTKERIVIAGSILFATLMLIILYHAQRK